jgi:hypothetical protein
MQSGSGNVREDDEVLAVFLGAKREQLPPFEKYPSRVNLSAVALEEGRQ